MDNKFSTKQALWFALINYVGVAIGMVSTLFIYPNDLEFLGIIRFIDGFAQILYPIMVLGASTALLNFQPRLTEVLQRKLFSYSVFSIIWMIFLCAIGVLVIYWFDWIKNKEYFIYGFLIAICLAYIDLMKRQATNLNKLAIPTFFEKIIPKLTLPVAFILVLYLSKSEAQALSFYTVSFVVILIAIAVYLLRYFKPVYTYKFTDLFNEISKKEYYQYSLYAFCSSLGSFFAFRIDSIMIPQYISNAANGDFNIGVNLANALMIPATGVFALYSPIISDALKKNDLTILKVKYAEVAKNLFFIGILMYGCVVLGMKDFFSLLPTASKLLPVVPVIYILGGNVILNMATGFNTEIIAYSKYYRFNLIAILLLALLNVGLNLYILKQTSYGIIGVAWASFISMFVFNVLKIIFIYKKFKILPFNSSYGKVLSLATILLSVLLFLPLPDFSKYDFIIKCFLYVTIFGFTVFFANWVPHLNNSINSFLRKWLKK